MSTGWRRTPPGAADPASVRTVGPAPGQQAGFHVARRTRQRAAAQQVHGLLQLVVVGPAWPRTENKMPARRQPDAPGAGRLPYSRWTIRSCRGTLSTAASTPGPGHIAPREGNSHASPCVTKARHAAAPPPRPVASHAWPMPNSTRRPSSPCCARGDEAAYRRLIRRFHGSLVGVASAIIGSRAQAEEVVQDAWLAVFAGIGRFEGRSTLASWIFTIVLNRARSRAGREGAPGGAAGGWLARRRGRGVPTSEFLADGHWREAPALWDELDPERVVGGRQLWDACAGGDRAAAGRAAGGDHPARHGGRSAEEACALLSLSPENQRVLLHRARSRVRRAIDAARSTARPPAGAGRGAAAPSGGCPAAPPRGLPTAAGLADAGCARLGLRKAGPSATVARRARRAPHVPPSDHPGLRSRHRRRAGAVAGTRLAGTGCAGDHRGRRQCRAGADAGQHPGPDRLGRSAVPVRRRGPPAAGRFRDCPRRARRRRPGRLVLPGGPPRARNSPPTPCARILRVGRTGHAGRARPGHQSRRWLLATEPALTAKVAEIVLMSGAWARAT